MVIGDRSGDRFIKQPITSELPINRLIQKDGDRLIEKMMFFVRRG